MREKLRSGLLRALEKRPVSVESIEAEIDQIKHRLRATGEREIQSLKVGEQVMSSLKCWIMWRMFVLRRSIVAFKTSLSSVMRLNR